MGEKDEILRRGTIRVEDLDSPELEGLVIDAVRTGRTLMFTREGKVSAVLEPATAEEVFKRRIADDPEMAAQLEAAASGDVDIMRGPEFAAAAEEHMLTED